MVVIVCGGRGFDDEAKLFRSLDYWHARLKITKLVQGGQVSTDPAERHLPWARRRKWGADYFAKRWAMARGIPNVEEAVSSEEWKRMGGSAGPIRNGKMLALHKPERVIALPGGRGTEDMLRQARNAGVKCIEVA